MRSFLVFTFLLAFTLVSFGQVVNIPDPNFKQALIDEGVDTNEDGEIQMSEASQITTLSISGLSIADLTGIETFSSLNYLDCESNEIAHINLNVLNNLETLIVSDNNISSLEVNENSELINLDVRNNPITELSIDESSKIQFLYTNGIETTKLTLSNLEFLTELYHSGWYDLRENKDTLILQNLPLLNTVVLEHDMYKLEVNNLPSLVNLTDVRAELVDIHQCLNLDSIYLAGNNFSNESKVVLSGLPKLKGLWIEGEFENLIADFNSFKLLESLSLTGGGFSLGRFYLKDLAHLKSLLIENVDIDTLHLENLHLLERFSDLSFLNVQVMSLINLTSLKFTRWREDLFSDMPNGLISVRLERLPLVDSILFLFDEFNDEIREFVVKDLPSLTHLVIDKYDGKELDLRALPALEKLSLAMQSPDNDEQQNLYFRNGKITNINFDFYGRNYIRICGDSLELEFIKGQLDISDLDSVELTTDCSILPGSGFYHLQGNVVLDIDDNGCDLNDLTVPGVHIINTYKNEINRVISNFKGSYVLYLEEGMSTIKLDHDNNYYSWDLNSFAIELPRDSGSLEQNICLIPKGEFNDLKIKIIPAEQLRPGFESDFIITYRNEGTTIMSGEIEMTYRDEFSQFIASNPIGVDDAGTISWSYEDLVPQEERKIRVTLRFNSPMDDPPLNGGDPVFASVTIFPLEGDETRHTNRHGIDAILVNSYDPNDKTCLQGNEITPEMVGEEVDYLIRFENTGTAEAVNVVVRDRIDTNVFEINTLQIIDASHKMETKISDGNLVEFIFAEIYLPFEDATNDGYISFSIKTKDDLNLGDVLENTAEIYFDFNWPIITNTAMTEVKEPVGIDESYYDFEVSLSPNPTIGFLQISASEPINSIELVDFNGRILRDVKYLSREKTHSINISEFEASVYSVVIHTDKGKKTKKVFLAK